METQTILLAWSIGATFVGPIIAVLITLWHQGRSSANRARLELFGIMMRHRRNALSAEFVGALNMVPVHFGRDKHVVERYAALMSTFEDNGWDNPSAVQGLNDKVETNIAYLLSEMSKAVKTPIEQLQILKGAYSPRGWADDQQRHRLLQDGLGRVLLGHSAIRVSIQPSSEADSPTPQDDKMASGLPLEPERATQITPGEL